MVTNLILFVEESPQRTRHHLSFSVCTLDKFATVPFERMEAFWRGTLNI